MPKAPKKSRPKQFLRWHEWRPIHSKLHDLYYVAQDHEYECQAGSKEAERLAKRMIALADALYKAAGAK